MAYATKTEIDAAIGGYGFIIERAKQFAEDYTSEFAAGWLNEGTVDVEADGITGEISFETEYSYCGCCSNDIDYHTLPLSYLWEDDWKEQVQTKRDKEKAETEKRRAKEKAKQKKEREKARYQSYLAMKEEYEK